MIIFSDSIFGDGLQEGFTSFQLFKSAAPNSSMVPSYELELELIQTQMAQKPMLRDKCTCVPCARVKNVRESGGMGNKLINPTKT